MGSGTEVVYDGLATVGRVKSILGMVVAHFFMVPIALLGLYLLLRDRALTASVPGTVQGDPQCVDVQCTMQYAFTLPGETQPRSKELGLTRTRVTTTTNGVTETKLLPLGYANGQALTVWFDPRDPVNTVALQNDDWRISGGVILFITAAILSMVWLNYHFTKKYKAVAALEGGASVVSMVSSAFSHR